MVQAFAQAATTFTSQNWAAREWKRCRRIFSCSMLWGAVFAAAISIPLVLFRAEAIRLYSTETAVQEFAYVRIMTVLILEPLCVIYEIPAAALRGMGHSTIPAVETILGTVVFRLLWLSTVFVHWRTFRMIFWVYPISWIFTGVLLLVSYGLALHFWNQKHAAASK